MDTAEARNIESLKEHVAKAFGRTLDSPADFDVMSLSIRERTGEYISPTTLKRLFGYVKPATVPRTSTLSVLSRYAGYAGWSDFCRSLGETWQEHAETGGRRIKPVHVISVSAVLACLAAVVALIFGGRAEPEAVREGQTGQEAEAAAGATVLWTYWNIANISIPVTVHLCLPTCGTWPKERQPLRLVTANMPKERQ